MESAKLSTVHFDSADVIATSGKTGIYNNKSYFTGFDKEPFNENKGKVQYHYIGFDSDLDHSDYENRNSGAYFELSYGYYIDDEPYEKYQELMSYTWYDEYYDESTGKYYWYTVQ